MWSIWGAPLSIRKQAAIQTPAAAAGDVVSGRLDDGVEIAAYGHGVGCGVLSGLSCRKLKC
ncbi:MAG: hypothetical protein ACKESB_03605 [Candidatus Hodgkinia cicadicola]